MDGAAYFTSVGGVDAAGFGVVGGVEGGYVALFVFFNMGAGDAVGAAQANFATEGEAFKFVGCVVHVVFAFDVAFAGEGYRAGAVAFVLGVVGNFELFGLVCGIVFDDEFDGVEDGHGAGGGFVEVVSDAGFEAFDFGEAFKFGAADLRAEVANGGGGEATAAHAADGG